MQENSALAAVRDNGVPASRDASSAAEAAAESAKRRQILDGARKVFLADGFDASSMNDIARIAGVSKGTLYVYFDSKVALFEALIRADRRQQAEQLFVIDEAQGDIRSVLVNFGVSLVQMITQPSCMAHARTVVAVAQKFPQLGRAFYEAGPQVGLDRLAAYLARHVEAGELVIDDVPFAAAQLIELWQANLTKRLIFRVVDRLPPEEIRTNVERGTDLFLGACGRP